MYVAEHSPGAYVRSYTLPTGAYAPNTCACGSRDQPSMPFLWSRSLFCWCCLVFKADLSLIGSWPSRLSWLMSKPGTLLAPPPSSRTRSVYPNACFFYGVLGMELGSSACTGGALLTELLLQPSASVVT